MWPFSSGEEEDLLEEAEEAIEDDGCDHHHFEEGRDNAIRLSFNPRRQYGPSLEPDQPSTEWELQRRTKKVCVHEGCSETREEWESPSRFVADPFEDIEDLVFNYIDDNPRASVIVEFERNDLLGDEFPIEESSAVTSASSLGVSR